MFNHSISSLSFNTITAFTRFSFLMEKNITLLINKIMLFYRKKTP